MKKRIAILLCAVAVMLSSTAMAWEDEKEYYPIMVESYTMGSFDTPCIKKVYQLSLSDDPSRIPTDDFERFGYVYKLMDITQSHDIGVDSKPHSESITKDSDTGELSEVLKQLEGQKEVTTEDGYSGKLLLDHTSVTVQAKGYKTSTRNLSASRTYPNLSDADLSLVPKTVREGGKTLNLTNVQWTTNNDENGTPTYTASATYAGTSTSRYATGYTVTANYVGNVAKANCEVVTYTAIFAGTKMGGTESGTLDEQTDEDLIAEVEKSGPVTVTTEPEEPESQAGSDGTDGEADVDADAAGNGDEESGTETIPEETEPSGRDVPWLSIIGCIGGGITVLAAGFYTLKKLNFGGKFRR